MLFSRREILAFLAQGIASRGVRPRPRGKPSGLPWHARFTDVAAEAGLTAPIVYGGVDRKNYIIETAACGVAFLDYDNDGWLDIFVLSGSRLKDAPEGATNRLYHNRGELDKTEPLYRKTLEIRRRVLGEEHPRTLFANDNLFRNNNSPIS